MCARNYVHESKTMLVRILARLRRVISAPLVRVDALRYMVIVLKGNGIVLSPLFATTWRSAFVLTQIVLVWSLHLYGAGSRTNKLYNHRSI